MIISPNRTMEQLRSAAFASGSPKVVVDVTSGTLLRVTVRDIPDEVLDPKTHKVLDPERLAKIFAEPAVSWVMVTTEAEFRDALAMVFGVRSEWARSLAGTRFVLEDAARCNACGECERATVVKLGGCHEENRSKA